MNINRNIIEDLLPIYLSGEASKDTNQLVDAFLAGDPGLERLVQKMLADKSDLPEPLLVTNEMAALRQTRRVIKAQTWLLGLAILFSLLPFSVVFSNENGMRWVWGVYPAGAVLVAIGGVGFWLAYGWLRHRLQTTVLF